MKERPILFSTEMIKAILAGTKTQTRRVIKPQPELKPGTMKTPLGRCVDTAYWHWKDEWWWQDPQQTMIDKCPYGRPGDRLWVKETWQAYTPQGMPYSALLPSERKDAELYNWAVVDKATNPELKHGVDPWIPSIFMPRRFSRITLEITGVRVERVQEISEYDAEAEGVNVSHYYCDEGEFPMHRCDPVGKFQELWDSINAKRGCGWQTNPYVWVIEFKRLEPVRELTPEEATRL